MYFLSQWNKYIDLSIHLSKIILGTPVSSFIHLPFLGSDCSCHHFLYVRQYTNCSVMFANYHLIFLLIQGFHIPVAKLSIHFIPKVWQLLNSTYYSLQVFFFSWPYISRQLGLFASSLILIFNFNTPMTTNFSTFQMFCLQIH